MLEFWFVVEESFGGMMFQVTVTFIKKCLTLLLKRTKNIYNISLRKIIHLHLFLCRISQRFLVSDIDWDQHLNTCSISSHVHTCSWSKRNILTCLKFRFCSWFYFGPHESSRSFYPSRLAHDSWSHLKSHNTSYTLMTKSHSLSLVTLWSNTVCSLKSKIVLQSNKAKLNLKDISRQGNNLYSSRGNQPIYIPAVLRSCVLRRYSLVFLTFIHSHLSFIWLSAQAVFLFSIVGRETQMQTHLQITLVRRGKLQSINTQTDESSNVDISSLSLSFKLWTRSFSL